MPLLAMFGLFRAAKFWTAVVLAIAQFINIYSGIDLALDEATVTAVLGGLGALLVWLIPNKKPSGGLY
ncbi:hypothetical protein [Aliihoeflea sp. 40Bstr573]|uniref:hypothetical protein n=1 Tax=Aliihoeflea sp. 40Bstr573 TaxID=2696467 RepID=UPI0020951C7B|nr:hypothetical protein [Aliihoeflea sp. 40Bstr573]MCO6386254.1 hypothetical protein [Aliihoeflea sp. 40Bstr573]